MIPTPTEIKYFLEVYQTLHISNSAIRLAITQPTLTQALQKLEEKVGTVLFHRTRQGMVPTAAGKTFYQHAQKLFENWNSLSSLISSGGSEIEGKFRIGCHPSVGAYALPPLLKELQTNAPKIELSLHHDFSRKILEKVVSYEVDLGFVINPIKHPDLVLRKLCDDQVTFWKKKGLPKTPKQLFADTELTQVQNLLKKTMRTHFSDWKLIETSSLELIRSLTNSGEGVGILPERIAKQSHETLVRYGDSMPVFHDELYLVYRKESLSSNAGRMLVKCASTVLE